MYSECEETLGEASATDNVCAVNFRFIRDRSLFIPGVGTEEIWVG
jgi:hypothetical protein